MKDKFTPGRLGDYYIFCDICGSKCWASESVLLDTYTGRGGLRVCPEDADPIDYGLVPYKVPAEKPVPFSRDTVSSADPLAVWNTTEYSPIIYENTGTSNQMLPELNNMFYLTIDQMVPQFVSYPQGIGNPSVTNNKRAVVVNQWLLPIELCNQTLF